MAAKRVDLTDTAADLLRRLAGAHGSLMFHQSGGCCDGSSPMCYPAGDRRNPPALAGGGRQHCSKPTQSSTGSLG